MIMCAKSLCLVVFIVWRNKHFLLFLVQLKNCTEGRSEMHWFLLQSPQFVFCELEYVTSKGSSMLANVTHCLDWCNVDDRNNLFIIISIPCKRD